MAEPNTLFGDDANPLQLLRRVLGFATPANVKLPGPLTAIGAPIPGENEEQKRMAGNRFQRDIGMPDEQMQHPTLNSQQPPPPRKTQEERDRLDEIRRQNLRLRIERSPRLHPAIKEKALQLEETNNTEMLRELLFPGGQPGVAT